MVVVGFCWNANNNGRSPRQAGRLKFLQVLSQSNRILRIDSIKEMLPSPLMALFGICQEGDLVSILPEARTGIRKARMAAAGHEQF